MTTVSAKYLGNLRTECTHLQSGSTIITSVPLTKDARPETPDACEICVASLAACAMTIMGIAAKNHAFSVDGMKAALAFEMKKDPYRIGRIQVLITMPPLEYTEKQKTMIVNAAHTCPVHRSLHPDMDQEFVFVWPGDPAPAPIKATILATYLGGLRCEITHVASGYTIVTDAPTDNCGRGEKFSPTDLASTALAACAMTIMGMAAGRHGFSIDGATVDVSKTMSANPRRIGKVEASFTMPAIVYTDRQKAMIANAANTCPVHRSLHPDTEQVITFAWPGDRA